MRYLLTLLFLKSLLLSDCTSYNPDLDIVSSNRLQYSRNYTIPTSETYNADNTKYYCRPEYPNQLVQHLTCNVVTNTTNSFCKTVWVYDYTVVPPPPDETPPPPPECSVPPSSSYPPEDGWILLASFNTFESCSALADGINYSTSILVPSDNLSCSSLPNPTMFCYAKPITPPDETPPPPDDNNPPPPDNNNTLDLSPLIDGQANINNNLNDIKNKQDITNNSINNTNNKLDDVNMNLNNISAKANNINSNLESLKSFAGTSNTKLDDIKNSIDGSGRDISDKLDLVNNNIGSGVGTINSKLTQVNDSITELGSKIDGSEVDTSNFDGFDDLLSGNSDFISGVLNQFSTFKSNITDNFSNIQSQYDNAKNIFLNSGSASAPSGSLSSDCASFTALGRTISLNLSYLSVISPIVYFIMTVFFMILNFGFLIRHLLKGSD